jgi:N utilization substance protein A
MQGGEGIVRLTFGYQKGKSFGRNNMQKIESRTYAWFAASGVKDELKDIPGVTTQMLIAFGEHGIKSIEDLADCATDDLYGWSESKDGKTIRHAGILGRFRASRKECDAIIIYARIKAGWIE